jgi:DNA primase
VSIPRHIVDAVRERTDIAEVIGRHVRLQRRGGSLLGRCPFHQEKSPSFSVSPEKGVYYCFGCAEGGDVFSFLMKIEGLSFGEAIRELAGPAGVVVEEREMTPEQRRSLRARAGMREALDEAAKFFERTLWSPQGSGARAYLEQRAMGREAARAARLGYAPGGWTALLDHLHRAGIPPELAKEAGLAKERRTGHGHYDAFRDRLIFPIRDERSRVIGFGGRIMSGDGPKYINSPETPLYQKSNVLYGIETARAAIQRQDRAVLVEGYFDVLSLHQAGFEEAVATCGTALTTTHLERIRRLTRDVVLVMDADEAGSRAAERSLTACLEAGVQAWRVVVPGAKDPDELVREQGPAAFEAALASREPLVEWYVQRKLAAHGGDAAGTQRVLDELLPVLVRLPDILVSRVAARLRVPEEVVRRRMRSVPRAVESAAAAPEPPPPDAWRPHRAVVHILWLLVHHHALVADLIHGADPELFANHAPVVPVIDRLCAGEPVAAVLPDVHDMGVRRTLNAVATRRELYEPDQALLGACQMLADLALPRWEARSRELTGRIAQASRAGDPSVRALLQERTALVRRIKSLRPTLNRRDVEAARALLAADTD